MSLEQLSALPDEAAIEAVKRGLPTRLLRQFSERVGVPLEALATPLQMTARALQRRIQEGTLGQGESERLLAMIRLFFQAVRVLGEETKAVRWLQSRPPLLLGHTPLESMDTWLGIRSIETILGRIEGGVYS